MYGGDGLIWRLYNSPHFRESLAELEATPALLLWQMDAAMGAFDRIAAKAAFEAQALADHRAAVAKARAGR